MNQETKCYKCGTKIPTAGKNAKQLIECPHCHAKLSFDATTKKHLKWIRYAMVLVIMIIIIFTLHDATKSKNYVAFAIILLILVLFSNFSEKSCIWILAHTFGLTYEKYSPEQENKKAK